MAQPQPSQAERPPGPSWQLSVALIVVGALLFVPLIVRGVGGVAEAVTAKPRAVPGEIDVNLRAGRYLLYERTGTRRGAGNFTFSDNNGVTLTPGMVRVTGPDGAPVPVGSTFANETITKGSAVYTGAVRFDAVTRGHYRIDVAGERPGQVLVARSLGDTFGRLGRPFLVALLGGLLGLLGIVLLVVGLIRRGGGRRQATPVYSSPAYGSPTPYGSPGYGAPAASPSGSPAPVEAPPTPAQAPPAGWYPDPGRPGGQRYWDGHAWTEHLA